MNIGLLELAVVAAVLAGSVIAGQAQTATPSAKDAQAAPQHPQAASNDPAAMSADFWTDWKKTKESADYQSLTAAQDCGCTVPAKNTDTKAPEKSKSVVNITITRPADAAQILSSSLSASGDPAQSAALATVVRMRIPEKVQKQAVKLVPRAQRQRVETFRATLSAGIPGLPGIYLGDNSGYYANDAPAGFEPVSGGSFGCRVRQ